MLDPQGQTDLMQIPRGRKGGKKSVRNKKTGEIGLIFGSLFDLFPPTKLLTTLFVLHLVRSCYVTTLA